MRKINPHDFTVARRGTSREINRQIALTLIRAHQPISRADLARLTCPIGIAELKSKEPAVIAVALAAQLLKLTEEAAA